MKKIRNFILSAAMLFILAPAFSQIRSYVGIVRQKYFPEHIKYFEKYRDELNDAGYTTYAKYIDDYLAGGFGSGFVYVAPDGTNYIITNRHVVSQAESASIEFEKDNSDETVKYENLKVLLTDDEIDIAILGFSNGEKPFKKGLKFSSTNVSDGQEVWSAGFPGLGTDPVWQLGKGTVTNSRAKIKGLLDPSISTLIQHSAQVDSGNSGGPLMIASAKSTAGYEVVGINTWKASWRDSTNFSIPASQIQKMISAVQKKSSVNDVQSLEDRSKKIALSLKDLGNDFTVIVKYISYERASTYGQNDFDSVMHYAPSKVRNIVLDAFSYDPAEGLRYACAYQIWKRFSAESNDGAVYTSGKVHLSGSNASVDLMKESKNEDEEKVSVTTTWVKEHGLWRLFELSDEEKFAEKKDSKKKSKDSKSESYFSSPEIDFYNACLITAGGDISLGGNPFNFNIGLDYFGKQSVYAYSFCYNRVTLDGLNDDVSLNLFSLGLALRIPIKMGSYGLTPYARATVGLGYGSSLSAFGWNAEAGLQAMFNTDEDFHYGVGISYKVLSLSDFKNETGETAGLDRFKNKSISIYAILSF